MLLLVLFVLVVVVVVENPSKSNKTIIMRVVRGVILSPFNKFVVVFDEHATTKMMQNVIQPTTNHTWWMTILLYE